MKARHKRFGLIAAGLILLVIATVLITKSFRSNLVFFFTPTQVEKGEAPKTGSFRIGGLVENGSLKRLPDGLHVQFSVIDTAKTMQVEYKGLLPDLVKDAKAVERANGFLFNGWKLAFDTGPVTVGEILSVTKDAKLQAWAFDRKADVVGAVSCLTSADGVWNH